MRYYRPNVRYYRPNVRYYRPNVRYESGLVSEGWMPDIQVARRRAGYAFFVT
jgi:hypothetical protein